MICDKYRGKNTGPQCVNIINQSTGLFENMQSDKWKNCWMCEVIVPSVVSKTQHLGKIIGITNVLRYSAFVRHWRQHMNEQCHSRLSFGE
jgi:hypothetical protein